MTYYDIADRFTETSGQPFLSWRRKFGYLLKKQDDKILGILRGNALHSMEVCRILNGIDLKDYKKCYRAPRLRRFTFDMYATWGNATLPERCSFIENECYYWSLDVWNALRHLEKEGKIKSTSFRWFDKRGGKLDRFRFWFIDPEDLRKRLLQDARSLKKILLILPCNKYAEIGNYKLGRNWKLVLKRIESWRDRIDLAAIDCINMLGLVPEWENYKTVGHNIYPSWEHFKNNPEQLEELSIAIARKLKELAPRYEQIIAYLNVKAYFLALKRASELSKTKVNFVEIDFNPISYAKNLPKLIETISVNRS